MAGGDKGKKGGIVTPCKKEQCDLVKMVRRS